MSPDIDDIIRMRLEHMLEATDAAAEFLADLPPDAEELDLKSSYAFRAVFITLGEAANRIPESYRDRHTDVPWAEIRQYRNFMVHVYHAIDAKRMRGVADESLPPLREQIIAMLDALPPSE